MPGAIHKIPDPNNVIIRAVAQQIHRKRKLDEQAKNEEEAREMEKKRKEEERRRNQELKSKSLANVKDELAKLNKKMESLKEEKHGLFSELKKVCVKSEEERRRTEASFFNPQMPPSNLFPPTQPPNQFNPNGRLSIMGGRKEPAYQSSPYQSMPATGFSPAELNPVKFAPTRILTPNSPGANPYLRAAHNPLQSRYLKMPQSPASPAQTPKSSYDPTN